MKKNHAISPWLAILNLGTSTSYAANGEVRRDGDFFQHRRVNRTFCFTSRRQVIGSFSRVPASPSYVRLFGLPRFGSTIDGQIPKPRPETVVSRSDSAKLAAGRRTSHTLARVGSVSIAGFRCGKKRRENVDSIAFRTTDRRSHHDDHTYDLDARPLDVGVRGAIRFS